MPLVFSLSELNIIDINYNIVVPTFFVIISFLLISKVPTYSFKKIVIPRRMTIFVLFGIVLFFGLLLVYTFKVLLFGGLIYLVIIPTSYFYYQKIKNKKNVNIAQNDNDEPEDIL